MYIDVGFYGFKMILVSTSTGSHLERCDFEDGLCDLQTPDQNKLWIRGACLTDPGPLVDHTGHPAGMYPLYNHLARVIQMLIVLCAIR